MEKQIVVLVSGPTGRRGSGKSLWRYALQVALIHGLDLEMRAQAKKTVGNLGHLSDFDNLELSIMNDIAIHGNRANRVWGDEFNILKLLREPPADHPSRKREPKGPRGKWGKL